jgi:hypothetical protein
MIEEKRDGEGREIERREIERGKGGEGVNVYLVLSY